MNRLLSYAIVCAILMLVHSTSATAAFLGVTYLPHTQVSTPAGLRQVYRVYALFTNPGDRLVSWGSTVTIPYPTTFRTLACSDVLGSNFYNAPNGSNAPSQELIDEIPHAQWDTFVTIGVSIADQGSGLDPKSPNVALLSPSFPNFASGNIWTSNNAAVYIAGTGPGTEQGLAGYAGDGDSQLRVLLAQITAMVGDGLSIRIGFVTWIPAGSTQQQTWENLGWDPADAQGRCCKPSGDCMFTTHGGCLMMGPNQWLGCEPCSECQPFTPCWGDVVVSGGTVNIDDLLLVINSWGISGPHPADANYDFSVDIDDLLLVINSWGLCP